jgi:hypothetical protein
MSSFKSRGLNRDRKKPHLLGAHQENAATTIDAHRSR